MKKKIFLALAIIAMLTCLFAITVSAATEVDGVYYNFNEEEQTATVAKDNCKTGCKLEVVVIPEKVNYDGKEYTVAAIDNYAFEYNTTIKTLVINPKLTKIPNGMVQGATSLKKLYIDFSNVTEIGSRALTLANKDDMNPVAGQEFKLYTPESYVAGVDVEITEISLTNVITINNAAFNNTSLKKVTIGPSCTTIGIQTFRFGDLEEIIVQSNADIPSYFCGHNASLKKITIGSPTKIGGSAFSGCTAVTAIYADMSRVTDVGTNAFLFASKYDGGNSTTQWYNLKGEKKVDLTSLEYARGGGQSGAFASSNVGSAEITWPVGLKEIGDQAFRKCHFTGTMYINAADGYTLSLSRWAFDGNAPTTIIFGKGVKTVDIYYEAQCTVIFLEDEVKLARSDAFKQSGSIVYYKSFSDDSVAVNNKATAIQITSGTAANYGACGVYASVTTADGTVVFDKTTHNYTFVDYDNTYCPINTMGNYLCSKCKDEKQVANEGTTPVKDGHSYDTLKSIVYEKGFLKAGVKTTVCNCTLEKAENVNAIFVFNGYSTKENGTAICVGYTINNNELKDYNSVNTPLTFGAVASIEAENVLSVDNGTVKGGEKTVVAPISSEYASFDFIISGFSAEQNQLALVMCAYVYDGKEIVYLGSTSATSPYTITLQAVIDNK